MIGEVRWVPLEGRPLAGNTVQSAVLIDRNLILKRKWFPPNLRAATSGFWFNGSLSSSVFRRPKHDGFRLRFRSTSAWDVLKRVAWLMCRCLEVTEHWRLRIHADGWNWTRSWRRHRTVSRSHAVMSFLGSHLHTTQCHSKVMTSLCVCCQKGEGPHRVVKFRQLASCALVDRLMRPRTLSWNTSDDLRNCPHLWLCGYN